MELRKIAGIILGAAALVCVADYIATSPSQTELDRDEYCEMVRLGKESKNEFGWPDFNGNYEEVCPTK